MSNPSSDEADTSDALVALACGAIAVEIIVAVIGAGILEAFLK